MRIGGHFDVFVEINFEKQPVYKTLFEKDIDVNRIVPLLSAMSKLTITPGKTLLFLDEIQECPEAIMALRFFGEDMPESVAKWVETHDFLQCQEVQDDILNGYEDDFPKYRKKVDPQLLRNTMRSVALQVTRKFVYSHVSGEYKSAEVKKAIEMLTKAGIVIPVTHSNANGLPLGNETEQNIRKMLLLDTGLLLRLLNMTLGDITEITAQILTASAADLVNKGTIAEMLAGLEYLHYQTPNVRHELFYWVRQSRNSLAEIDYVIPSNSEILPVEVKAGVQGGMKSLWEFMREKKLTSAVRCSLENFGEFEYVDNKADNAVRHVKICPLYAVSQMNRLMQK